MTRTCKKCFKPQPVDNYGRMGDGDRRRLTCKTCMASAARWTRNGWRGPVGRATGPALTFLVEEERYR